MQRSLVFRAAVLMFLGFLTGGVAAGAMTGQINANPHMMLASHLNALLGAFWMIGVAWTLPMMRFGEKARARLAQGVTIANYANWAVTMAKSFLKVNGLEWTGDTANDEIFALLTLLVVIPSLATTVLWIYGLTGTAQKEA